MGTDIEVHAQNKEELNANGKRSIIEYFFHYQPNEEKNLKLVLNKKIKKTTVYESKTHEIIIDKKPQVSGTSTSILETFLKGNKEKKENNYSILSSSFTTENPKNKIFVDSLTQNEKNIISNKSILNIPERNSFTTYKRYSKSKNNLSNVNTKDNVLTYENKKIESYMSEQDNSETMAKGHKIELITQHENQNCFEETNFKERENFLKFPEIVKLLKSDMNPSLYNSYTKNNKIQNVQKKPEKFESEVIKDKLCEEDEELWKYITFLSKEEFNSHIRELIDYVEKNKITFFF